ncbi:hypothetical protein GF385_02765, partial [Candidatus Dependentiae bacterium]|nr:hypothetical protein [Candidatus Dependentiae bacterium]
MKKIIKILFFILILIVKKSFAEKCPICYEEYDEKENIECIMQCCNRHICENCINQWKYDCPFCKKSPIVYLNLITKKIILLKKLRQPIHHPP